MEKFKLISRTFVKVYHRECKEANEVVLQGAHLYALKAMYSLYKLRNKQFDQASPFDLIYSF